MQVFIIYFSMTNIICFFLQRRSLIWLNRLVRLARASMSLRSPRSRWRQRNLRSRQLLRRLRYVYFIQGDFLRWKFYKSRTMQYIGLKALKVRTKILLYDVIRELWNTKSLRSCVFSWSSTRSRVRWTGSWQKKMRRWSRSRETARGWLTPCRALWILRSGAGTMPWESRRRWRETWMRWRFSWAMPIARLLSPRSSWGMFRHSWRYCPTYCCTNYSIVSAPTVHFVFHSYISLLSLH